MTNLRLLTKQTTGSSPVGILVTNCVANGYNRWSQDRSPTTDPPAHSLNVAVLPLETFPHVDLVNLNVAVLPLKTFPHIEVVRASTDQPDHERAADEIVDLGEAGYRVRQPIPVRIKRIGHRDFEASFREANIAMSGSDSQDAYEALVADVLETFDVLTAEQTLGPDAAEQLRILRTYIVRT